MQLHDESEGLDSNELAHKIRRDDANANSRPIILDSSKIEELEHIATAHVVGDLPIGGKDITLLNVDENIMDIVHDHQRIGEEVTTTISKERLTLPRILTHEAIDANVAL